MTSFRFQSVLFALVLLISVMVSSSRNVAQGEPTSTTGAAEAVSVSMQSALPESPILTLSHAAAALIASLPNAPPARAVSFLAARPEEGEGSVLVRGAPMVFLPETEPRYAKTVELQAPIAVAKEFMSGERYAVKGAGQRWPLASLTKLMTALVAVEAMPLETPTTITAVALAAEGTAGGFAEGEIFSVFDLVTAALLASSNDAAEAIAARYGRERFVDAMQARARILGMAHTSYFDPTGISYLNQSTLEDQELLLWHLMTVQPELLRLTARGRAVITEVRTGAERALVSTHPFAGTPRFLGGKTGYTDEAYGNLLSLFKIGDRTVLIGVMGSRDRKADTDTLYGIAAGS